MNSVTETRNLRITPSQEDYLEVILRLETEKPADGARVTDIATALGTRLPTVTRTVQKLTSLGLTDHQNRGAVRLTETGRKLAREFVHRHSDLVAFFSQILGLPKNISEADTCKIEHGISVQTAQRLHEFVNFVKTLPPESIDALREFRSQSSRTHREFKYLPDAKPEGWRG